jgi:hypothetical protein
MISSTREVTMREFVTWIGGTLENLPDWIAGSAN